jgi:alkanesulfonate monooxygenase SsuD/methylene tetrahydromethanopterin reductase-like flavin-dependent oxidoreductase (luciferase family)
VHALGYVADTTKQAADELWPAHQHTFSRIGRERGWPPTTRAAFDATSGPTGAFFVGDPQTVATKMRYVDEALGGIKSISLMMSGGLLSHEKMARAIELLGKEVKPLVNKAVAATESRLVSA